MSLIPSTPNAIDPSQVMQSTLGFLPQFYDANRRYSTINQNGPFGSTSWTTNPDGSMTQNQQYSPLIQQTYENSLQHGQNIRGVADQALGGAQAAIGGGFNPSNLPALSGRIGSNPVATGIDRSGFSAIPGANDFGGERQRVEDATFNRFASRADNRFARGEADLDTKLRNQGFVQGTEAYDQAKQDFNNAKTDAYQQAAYNATTAGGAEQSRMLADALRVRGQQDTEGLESAGLFNQAGAQDFGQRLQGSALGNQARGQAFNEQLTTHETPISDFTQLQSTDRAPQLPTLGNGQIQANPTGMPNMAQLYGLQYAGSMDAYNRNMGLFNQGAGIAGNAVTSLLGGGGSGVGGAAGNWLRQQFGGGVPTDPTAAAGMPGGFGSTDTSDFTAGGGSGEEPGGFGSTDTGMFSPDPSQFDPNTFDWSQWFNSGGGGDDYSWLFGG